MLGRNAAAAQALPALSRAFGTSSAASASAPAVAGSGGLFGFLGGSGNRVTTPLTEPLEGVDEAVPLTPGAAPTTESTKLANGAVVASEDSWGPTVSLGLCVKSGSVYETHATAGSSHLLEALAFKATTNRTHFRLVREIEAIGATVTAAAGREQMFYSMQVPKASLPAAVELLTDSVMNPAFKPWEVAEASAALDSAVANVLSANPVAGLSESIHQVAYSGPLSNPLLASGPIDPDTLAAFVAATYTPSRMVLSGAGCDHSSLVGLAKPLLESGSADAGPAAGESKYTGGFYSLPGSGPLTHGIVAFPVPGWSDLKGSVTATVASMLLGGGGSFSAGGPGKGMHSRIYQRVLSKHTWMQQCTAWSQMYDNTGLLGVCATAASSNGADMMAAAADELIALTKPVSAEELERAKNATKGTVLMVMESNGVVAEDLSRQFLTYGGRTMDAGKFESLVDSVTAADVAALVTTMLKSAPSVAAAGNVAMLPGYDAIKGRFN